MSYALRTIFKKEIISEFLPPKRKTNKVIILCGGMPSYPGKNKLIEFLSKKGYWAFTPRYRGSWESYGEFLERSPEEDILDIIEEIPRGFVSLWDNKRYKIKNPEIYLIGSSFGGPAAILSSKNKKVKKIIAFAPVIDWRANNKSEHIDRLAIFVKKAFGNGYRFSINNWNKLKKGNFYNPMTNLKKIDGAKIWIVQARDDKTVPYKPSIEFNKLTGCKLTLLKKGGHDIGKLIINPKFYKKIRKFFTQK